MNFETEQGQSLVLGAWNRTGTETELRLNIGLEQSMATNIKSLTLFQIHYEKMLLSIIRGWFWNNFKKTKIGK